MTQAERSARWRAKHPDKVRENQREYRQRKWPQVLATQRDYRRRHPRLSDPVKVKARRTVSNAIRDGRMKRGVCEVCGASRAEAHHTDYSKPLDVQWLCKLHHEALEHGL